jgi:hypothetical protein
MNDRKKVTNPGLLQISQQLKSISEQFQQIIYTHISQELNFVADTLSKGALHLDVNKFVLEEFYEGKSLSKSECNIYDM